MREYIINDTNSGKKLFRFIKGLCPSIKNGDLFKIIRTGTITVNGKKKDYNYELTTGDTLSLFLAESHFTVKEYHFPTQRIEVAGENGDLLIAVKPAGLLSHPDRDEYKNTMLEYIKGYLYRKGEFDPANPFHPTLCNRLDYNTSGLIVAAKNFNALKKTTGIFRNRDLTKKYVTVVCGKIENRMLITSEFETDLNNTNRVKVINSDITYEVPDKKEFFEKNPALSATLVTPIYTGGGYTLVDVELWTGKKHQIRAHLTSAGHPLINDQKYFIRTPVIINNDDYNETYFLHSYYLDLGEYGIYRGRLPETFISALTYIFNDKHLPALRNGEFRCLLG